MWKYVLGWVWLSVLWGGVISHHAICRNSFLVFPAIYSWDWCLRFPNICLCWFMYNRWSCRGKVNEGSWEDCQAEEPDICSAGPRKNSGNCHVTPHPFFCKFDDFILSRFPIRACAPASVGNGHRLQLQVQLELILIDIRQATRSPHGYSSAYIDFVRTKALT